ncbi:MAG: hypothetical protein NTX51_18425 [Verrucomicrobia bacterium]|nr:hypothetical protein [Verrucomicrobiota bacterium]
MLAKLIAISAAALVAGTMLSDATPGHAGTGADTRESRLPPFAREAMAGVDDLIFAARKLNDSDGHWYSNLGYYAHDPNRKGWREGAKLYRWNLASGKLTTLLDDPRGGVRDPQVHYDGRRILFTASSSAIAKAALSSITFTKSTPTARGCDSSPTAPTMTSNPPTCLMAKSSLSRPAASAG